MNTSPSHDHDIGQNAFHKRGDLSGSDARLEPILTEDPLYLLQETEDPIRAAQATERLLRSPEQAARYCALLLACQDHSVDDLMDISGGKDPCWMPAVIETFGLVPAVVDKTITREQLAAFLRDPAALQLATEAIQETHSPYWTSPPQPVHSLQRALLRQSHRAKQWMVQHGGTICRVLVFAALVASMGGAWVWADGRTSRIEEEARVAMIEKAVALRREYEYLARQIDLAGMLAVGISVVPDADGTWNTIRVEAPKGAETLLARMRVSWGDASESGWTTVWDQDGRERLLVVDHQYQLPQDGRRQSFNLQVELTLTEQVASLINSVQSLDNSVLHPVYPVSIDGDGVHIGSQLLSTPASLPSAIDLVSPSSGASGGFKTKVELRASAATPRITLLVQQKQGTGTAFIQPGARSLAPDETGSFEISLGTGRHQGINEEFEIIAVADDRFRPPTWSIEEVDIPDRVVARRTVRKVAGLMAVTRQDDQHHRVYGRVDLPYGAMLLGRRGNELVCLLVFEPRMGGSSFDEQVAALYEPADLLLAVRKQAGPLIAAGNPIELNTLDAFWVYPQAQLQPSKQ